MTIEMCAKCTDFGEYCIACPEFEPDTIAKLLSLKFGTPPLILSKRCEIDEDAMAVRQGALE